MIYMYKHGYMHMQGGKGRLHVCELSFFVRPGLANKRHAHSHVQSITCYLFVVFYSTLGALCLYVCVYIYIYTHATFLCV